MPGLRTRPGIQLEQEATDPTEADDHASPVGGFLLDPTLALLADLVDDLEGVRIATDNRLRALTRGVADSDGEVRGLGLDSTHPAVARVTKISATIAAAEHGAELALKASLRAHPLGPWMAGQVGIGEKQGARLLAAVGDPFWNSLHNRPRTVSELWAYCGLHVVSAGRSTGDSQCPPAGGDPVPAAQARIGVPSPCGSGDRYPGGGDTHSDSGRLTGPGVAPARARGQRANWNGDARKRCWLVAQSCIKAVDSPYREVYDEGRAKYADAVHQVECRRCGPAGKPAAAGSPLSDGHKHARAIRLQMKAILKDLWLASRALYPAESSPPSNVDAHPGMLPPEGTSTPPVVPSARTCPTASSCPPAGPRARNLAGAR